MVPIDKVRTVDKPNCNKTVLVKKEPARVNLKSITTLTKNENGKIISDILEKATSHARGGGTVIVDYLTDGVDANVPGLLKGDGTDIVDCLIKEDK